MKQKLLILIMSLTVTLLVAQEYSKSSIEVFGGLTKVRDITSVKPLNFDIGYRYMFNTKFGFKLDAGHTALHNTPIKYFTSSFNGVVNIGRLLEFESFSKHYTIITGVGGTYTHSTNNSLILHRDSNFHLSGFINNEFKLDKRTFLSIGLDVITGVNSRAYTIDTPTATTSIINFNVGFTFALNSKGREHADWYIKNELPIKDTIYLQPTIQKEVKNINVTSVVDSKLEHVYFKNDSYVVDIQGLNAIKKIANNLTNNQTIHLTGYASSPASNEYNKTLSDNRCLAVRAKLISLGINTERIFITPYGEIDTIDGLNEDVARYVEIFIK